MYTPKMHFPRGNKVLYALILWRLTSVYIVQTAHVPDEYWQSLEVAHSLSFGYGYRTWEWTAGIRSYIYPFLISILYRILAFLSLDNVQFLTILPRAIQAIISAYAEYRFYKWTGNKWTLYSLCVNWYWYYCATRTMANTIETAATMIAISMFPWRDSNTASLKFLWIVGYLCTIRPTAAIIWIPMCLYHFCTSPKSKIVLTYQYSTVAGVCLISSILLDSFCYGSFVISQWEFFRVNVLYAAGDLYGKEPFLWYIFSGLPILLGLYYIIFILCIWHIVQHPASYHRQAIMLVVIGWTLGIYSLLSHKEFRFILPLLPMLIYICTSCRFRLNIKFTQISRSIFIALLLTSNVFPGLYFSVIHQRGSLNVMKVLEKDINADNCSILFLTPCHATPLYSHLHINVPTKILTCVPNFNGTNNYMDESDTFFAHPIAWLASNYNDVSYNMMPTHVVVFDSIIPKIKPFFTNYEVHAKVFHAHFPQRNYGRFIYVYKRKQRLLMHS